MLWLVEGPLISKVFQKVHSFNNSYDSKISKFGGELDHSLMRLRDEISNGYNDLNTRLHRLKFQSEREIARKEADLRDYDKAVRNITNNHQQYK